MANIIFSWLRAGTKWGLRRKLAAWHLNRFRHNSTVYYHGTTSDFGVHIRANGINLTHGRPNLDFGQGFYLTTSRSHAVARAYQMVKRFGGTEEILTFRVSNKKLSKLRGIRFFEPNDAWRRFVIGNRTGTLGPHGYDYVSGPVLRNLKAGNAWPFPNLNQISLHSEAAAKLFYGGLRL
ncbi:DUF3990 domain-containing protein [bacterium]|nr:DUF3990 domain-containing protein [bacterium]